MGLGINFFLTNLENAENKKQRLVQELENCRRSFIRIELYPHLTELICLYNAAMTVFYKKELLENFFPKTFKIDPEKQLLISEPTVQNLDETEQQAADHIKTALHLIEWSLPHLDRTIREGANTYDFVAEKIVFEIVGILPKHQEMGYLIIVDDKRRTLHIYRYRIFIRALSAEEPERVLQTEELDALHVTLIHPPLETVKANLVREYPGLPMPATFFAQPKIDFPYDATIFPVAKREFLKFISRS